MNISPKTSLFSLLVIICLLSILPFIGLSDYHTKGEPREAVVAQSMFNSRNWVLPVNNGGDMAYKPPMFHWSAAVSSLPFGEVNEFSSRFPSAMSVIIIALCCFLFYQKRLNGGVAFLSSLLFISAFEVHRAGMAARVDMVLTLFIVLAILQLYMWYEHNLQAIPLWAILFMSAATLTKGPVGIILPCAVCGVFLLIKGIPFLRAFRKLSLVALCACILPALWYYMAYLQGGDEFLRLVMEENFGRFLGKMSYESHELPIYYYFYITMAGFLPWTILVVLSLFVLKYSKPQRKFRYYWEQFKHYIQTMDSARLYTLLSIAIIFIFYCIPKSKRSVYLLPIYPFISLFLAEYMIYLLRNKPQVWQWFGRILSIVLSTAMIVLTAGWLGWIPTDLIKGIAPFIAAIKNIPVNFWTVSFFILPWIALSYIYRYRKEIAEKNRYMYSVIALFFCFQFTLDGVVLPTVLNQKSMKPFAIEIIEKVPEGKIYSYVAEPMLRFFVVNFYAHDRVVDFEKEKPTEGYLLVGQRDFEYIQTNYQDQYNFFPELISKQRGNDIRDIIYLYRFTAKK